MMEYKGYIGKVEFDDEAGVFHGELIGIRDVVTFEGDSVDELRRAFRDSVDDYLEFCEVRGESPDRPYSGKFQVRISPELHRRVSMLAGMSGQSLNATVAECLEENVERRFMQHGVTGPARTANKEVRKRRRVGPR